jgi:hypothetical protein
VSNEVGGNGITRSFSCSSCASSCDHVAPKLRADCVFKRPDVLLHDSRIDAAPEHRSALHIELRTKVSLASMP